MLRFTEKKISCQKLLRIENVNKEIINGGYKTQLSVSIDGMLNRPVQNNGELNGEVGTYRAKFTVNNNRIFAVRDLSISDLSQYREESYYRISYWGGAHRPHFG